MKLTTNEIYVLKLITEDPETKNSEIASRLNITAQAVGKIRKQLQNKGIIKRHEAVLDYQKLGLGLHAIALMKLLPKAHKSFQPAELQKILQPANVVRSYHIPQSEVTHIMIYAFRNIDEYDNYFMKLQEELGEYIEIKNAFVFSSGSIIKSSSQDVFLKVLLDAQESQKK